ncbi:thioredoxin family protein [Ornithinibacillus halophilus]|uniref:Thioredoxin n=1 Tax=Ornithinibacillus halophilus TaxID=930117 RepID=A0A1M5M896_9BACI|nr:thioredoxin family protein [Ornithinibacillus halophilus]SHG73456.1 Thioredoxin [Ornithinibacillus halophilus]
MQKKMIAIIAVIVVLFAALLLANNYKNNKALNDNENPYGTNDLDQATIDQLDNPLYGNQILPDELEEKVENGDKLTVYFYSPTCSFCQKTTPYLVPLTEDLGIDMKKLNLLEFGSEGSKYGVKSTPTVVHFDDGEVVASIIGQRTEEEYTAFFNEFVLE